MKYGFVSFADWLWSVIVLALVLKMILDLLDINSTQTDIAYAHLISPHSCDTYAMYDIWGRLRNAPQITCDYLGKNRCGIIAHIHT